MQNNKEKYYLKKISKKILPKLLKIGKELDKLNIPFNIVFKNKTQIKSEIDNGTNIE